MVRPRRDRLGHRQLRSTGSICISRKSTRPTAANSSRCARRCWRRRRAGRRRSDGCVARMSASDMRDVTSVWRRPRISLRSSGLLVVPRRRHRRLRALCDKFFVQPATAVVAPPNLSAHQPAGYAASRHDDPPQMPGGWFGSAPLQSKLADVDGRKSDRCHADPLGSSCPLQASPTAGISAPLITIVAPAATARNNAASSNPVLDPRDTQIIANRAATVVNEVRVST